MTIIASLCELFYFVLFLIHLDQSYINKDNIIAYLEFDSPDFYLSDCEGSILLVSQHVLAILLTDLETNLICPWLAFFLIIKWFMHI